MRKFDTRGDTPTMDTDDDLKVETVAHPFRFREFANESEVTALIVEAVNRISGAGESAEEDYRGCIDKLSRKTKLVSSIIQAEYFDLPDDAYLDRWALIMLAVELQNGRILNFFKKVLSSEIPGERSKDPHSFTTVGEEVMIRTTVIEGLERLAADGNEGAVELLFRNIGHESFSIRRAATQALLAVGGDEMRRKLEDELPKRHHDLLKIRRTAVQEAEQAEGGLFVKNRDDADTPAPNKEGPAKAPDR